MSANSVAIVGHGLSLQGACLGEEIDGHDVVIRFASCCLDWYSVEDFGKKSTILVTRRAQWTYAKKDTRGAETVWFYGPIKKRKEGKFKMNGREVPMLSFPGVDDTNRLRNFYGAKRPPTSPKRHLAVKMSRGTLAVLVAIRNFGGQIDIYGFDNTKDPLAEDRYGSVGAGYSSPGHDHAAERRMIDDEAEKQGAILRWV